jgi:hypothetical protein
MYVLAPDSSICDKTENAVEQRGILSSDDGSVTSSLFWECVRQRPLGRYTVRRIARDRIANKTASRDIPITIADEDQFFVSNLRLATDKADKLPAGGNLTVGRPVFALCDLYLPKSASSDDVEVTVSFLDQNRKQISVGKEYRGKLHGVDSHGRVAHAFVPNRPGSYFLRVEFKDIVTQQTMAKEMPFNVHLAPELPQRALRRSSR